MSPALSWLLLGAVLSPFVAMMLRDLRRERAEDTVEPVELLPEHETNIVAVHWRGEHLRNEQRMRAYNQRLSAQLDYLTGSDAFRRRCEAGVAFQRQLRTRPSRMRQAPAAVIDMRDRRKHR